MHSHVKPEGGGTYISYDDNPGACKESSMEKFRKHVENVVSEICHKLLNMLLDELWGDHNKPPEEEYSPRCDFISPNCKPPFKTAGRSSVYLMLMPKQELYIGEVYIVYINFKNKKTFYILYMIN